MKSFTLIEMLIAVSITVLLSSVLIIYSRVGENQIILFKDQARIVGTLLRAKNLAFQIYSEGAEVCGYGAYLDPVSGNFIIYKDLADPCSNSDNKYSGASEDFELNKLDLKLKFSNPEFSDILFIPPEPKVIIDGDPAKKGEFSITIETSDGANFKKIKINDFGQISAE
jgi:hypothetical protein